ncbi:MAG: DMT family transporter [Actinobacteria bacterium]|nr:DMT family transporter [Actinomycetota bacterium]
MSFGTLAVVAKLAYRIGAEPLPLLATRFAIATLLLAAVELRTKSSPHMEGALIVRLMLLGGLGYALEAALFFAALQRSPASEVSLVFYSYPLWTALLSFALRMEPFRWQLIAALGLGLAGVGTLFSFSVPEGGLAGPLLALGAAASIAVFLVIAQLVLRDVASGATALWTAAGATVSLGVAGVAGGQSFSAAALPAAAALGVATAIAFVALYAAIARIGSARTSVAGTLEPVTTVSLAVAVLAEPLTLRLIAGTILVICALPVLTLSRRSA